MLGIEVLGVAIGNVGYESGDPATRALLEKKVKVIGHEAVGNNVHLKMCFVLELLPDGGLCFIWKLSKLRIAHGNRGKTVV